MPRRQIPGEVLAESCARSEEKVCRRVGEDEKKMCKQLFYKLCRRCGKEVPRTRFAPVFPQLSGFFETLAHRSAQDVQ